MGKRRDVHRTWNWRLAHDHNTQRSETPEREGLIVQTAVKCNNQRRTARYERFPPRPFSPRHVVIVHLGLNLFLT